MVDDNIVNSNVNNFFDNDHTGVTLLDRRLSTIYLALHTNGVLLQK